MTVWGLSFMPCESSEKKVNWLPWPSVRPWRCERGVPLLVGLLRAIALCRARSFAEDWSIVVVRIINSLAEDLFVLFKVDGFYVVVLPNN